MKKSKKILSGAVAGLLTLEIGISLANPNSVVQAAKADSITLNHNAYVYTNKGARTYYHGQRTLKTGSVVHSTGKATMIAGKSYYPLDNGAYIKANNVGIVGKEVQKGNLELNYNSYVYGKNGKRLTKYRGRRQNTHMRKGTPLKYARSITATDRDVKQYFLLDNDNYHQSWLPYKKIKGKYYYNIGAGGYINAANVGKIDNKPLYIKEATVTVPNDVKTLSGVDSEEVKINSDHKVKVDRVAVIPNDPEDTPSYRVSGTNTVFFAKSIATTKPRQKLLNYTKNTYVQFTNDANTYDITGEERPSQLLPDDSKTPFIKGNTVPVSEKLYLWVAKDNQAELFYHLKFEPKTVDRIYYENNKDNRSYIKVSETNHYSGALLAPSNTPEQAEADAQIATVTDKQVLQKLVDQSATIQEIMHKNGNDDYILALQNARDSLTSQIATITEIKQDIIFLQQCQQIFSLNDKQWYNNYYLDSIEPE